MSLWEAHELAIAAGSASAGFAVDGVSIDTRTLNSGDLFVALRGVQDGHDFVAEAFARGAAGAMVSRAVAGFEALLVVDDSLAALERLGEFARARGKARVVAVTGSVGKTTTKEMLRRVLRRFGSVHAADASFNNHIGVPLTLARMARGADFCVLEIGMNHAGEILPLARLARPHVAVVTGVERAHVGLLGSVEEIGREKAQIFKGLLPAGVAVLPRDSAFLPVLSAGVPAGAGRLSFGAGDLADVRLIEAESDAEGCAVTARVKGDVVRFRLSAPGRHMAMNALAVLAVCEGLGLDLEKACGALEGFAPVAGRGARRDVVLKEGTAVRLLDESYNASGVSMRAAFAVLALQPGRRVAVLGDMLELGDEAEDEHLALRDEVCEAADVVFAAGEMMGRLFEALPEDKKGVWAKSAAVLAPVVVAALQDGDSVLVKASNGSRMRDVIAAIEGGG